VAVERETHGKDAAFLACRVVRALALSEDLRVLYERDVELRGLFGLGLEPQERRDFLHVEFSGCEVLV
jgi:hypothetical protein